MKNRKITGAICFFLSAVLAVTLTVPARPEAAAAEEKTEISDQRGKSDQNGTPGEKETQETQETDLLIKNAAGAAQAGGEKTAVSGLRITGVLDPAAQPAWVAAPAADAQSDAEQGSRLDETAEVVTAEGITWEIPVFWVNADSELVKEGTPGQDCVPVLAFFVPEDYRVEDETERGITVTLDAYLSSLFEKAGGAVYAYEPKTKITYILAGDIDFRFPETEDARKLPKPIPGLEEEESAEALTEEEIPEEKGSSTQESTSTEKGDSAGESTSAEEGDPEQESNSEQGGTSTQENDSEEDDASTEGTASTEDSDTILDKEKLLAHCADNTIAQYGEDEMAAFVNLIINCIQPQAVNLIRSSFPSFSVAAEQDGLGDEIGLYVYRNYKDSGDTTVSHKNASSSSCAYSDCYVALNREQDAYQIEYLIGVNTAYFEVQDEEGNYHIDTSGENLTDLDNTILHEMLHVFLYDYNRTGATGMTDISVFVRNIIKYNNEKEIYAFPDWFEEGLASCVEYNYNLRYDTFKLLRYEGEGVIGESYTKENLLGAYTTKEFILTGGSVFNDDYDLDDPNEAVTSCYATGYLADLYLGEMAAVKAGLGTAVTDDGEGNKTVSSETIRMGISSILERLHGGECLDEIICDISGGSYQNTEDFEAKFIKGEKGTDEGYCGDEASISFVVDFLNYMQDVEEESGKIPNGSVLFDFDETFSTPIDHQAFIQEHNYQINDSDDYVFSTVVLETPHTDAGKSKTTGGVQASNSVLAAAGESTERAQQTSAGDDLLAARVTQSAADELIVSEAVAGSEAEPEEEAEETVEPEEAPEESVETEEAPEETVEPEEAPEEAAEDEEVPEETAEAEEVPEEAAEPEE